MNTTEILVVDDSPFFRSFLKKLIRVKGITSNVIEAYDGLDAIQKYQKFRPDLVTMDVTMPYVDGIKALQTILKMDPYAKVIMVSSVLNEQIVDEAMRMGARGYIKKPFDNVEVVETIDKVLKQEAPILA